MTIAGLKATGSGASGAQVLDSANPAADARPADAASIATPGDQVVWDTKSTRVDGGAELSARATPAPSAPGAPTKPAGDQGMGAVMNSLGKLMEKAARLGSNLWVQGGLAIGSTLSWLGGFGAAIAGIAVGVGLVVSFCQFMKSLMKDDGKPDWVALARTFGWAVALFVPGLLELGAFAGILGMIDGAMSSGKDVVAPGTPRTGAQPQTA